MTSMSFGWRFLVRLRRDPVAYTSCISVLLHMPTCACMHACMPGFRSARNVILLRVCVDHMRTFVSMHMYMIGAYTKDMIHAMRTKEGTHMNTRAQEPSTRAGDKQASTT